MLHHRSKEILAISSVAFAIAISTVSYLTCQTPLARTVKSLLRDSPNQCDMNVVGLFFPVCLNRSQLQLQCSTCQESHGRMLLGAINFSLGVIQRDILQDGHDYSPKIPEIARMMEYEWRANYFRFF